MITINNSTVSQAKTLSSGPKILHFFFRGRCKWSLTKIEVWVWGGMCSLNEKEREGARSPRALKKMPPGLRDKQGEAWLWLLCQAWEHWPGTLAQCQVWLLHWRTSFCTDVKSLGQWQASSLTGKLKFMTGCLGSVGSERGFGFMIGPSTQLLPAASPSTALRDPL